MVTLSKLNEYFTFNGEGVLIWKVNRNSRARLGAAAGRVRPDGYCSVGVDGKDYLTHRIVWCMVCNVEPYYVDAYEVDHIDGDPSNNVIGNLRLTTKRGNQSNQYKHRAGKLVGCTYQRKTGTWRAAIQEGRKQRYLGCFPTEEAAHVAYKLALESL